MITPANTSSHQRFPRACAFLRKIAGFIKPSRRSAVIPSDAPLAVAKIASENRNRVQDEYNAFIQKERRDCCRGIAGALTLLACMSAYHVIPFVSPMLARSDAMKQITSSPKVQKSLAYSLTSFFYMGMLILAFKIFPKKWLQENPAFREQDAV